MRDIFFVRNRNHQFFILGAGKPVPWRQRDIPYVSRNFEFDPHMIERAVSLRTSHPDDSRRYHARQPPMVAAAYLQHDGGIRSRIAYTLILAAVAIHHNRLR